MQLSDPIACISDAVPIWSAQLDSHELTSERILGEFYAAERHWDHSHAINGRWENTYYPKAHASHTVAFLESCLPFASKLIGGSLRLRHDPAHPEGNAWWINRAASGEKTAWHDHSHQALMSAVYYLKTPPDSGSIVFELESNDITEIAPNEGMILFFKPSLRHAVLENKSNEFRISLAFNMY